VQLRQINQSGDNLSGIGASEEVFGLFIVIEGLVNGEYFDFFVIEFARPDSLDFI
jgi:hypothetical protein